MKNMKNLISCKRAMWISLLLLAGTGQVLAEEEKLTPYRPSVASPAQLSTPGQLELELGGLVTIDYASRRSAMPYLFKLAFSEEWGVSIGGDGYVSISDLSGGEKKERMVGIGDTNLTLKRAFIVDKATAFGVELSANIPTAKKTIGSGSADYAINSIFSRDFDGFHLDLNLGLTRTGKDRSNKITSAVSFSVPLGNEKWQAIGELSGSHNNGGDGGGSAQVLYGFSYSPNNRLTVDFGLVNGVAVYHREKTDRRIFAGLVIPLAKLW